MPQQYRGQVKYPPLFFTHWASVKTAWCCHPDVLRFASFRVTQKDPEVAGTENQVNTNLPFLLDQNSIAKMQS